MPLPHTKNVFCDWLDFTVPCSSHDYDSLLDFWQALHFMPTKTSSNVGLLLRAPKGGSVKINSYRSVFRVSVSGSSLDHLRETSQFETLVIWLSENPHHITRFDAAYDVPVAGPKVIKALSRKHKDSINLSTRSTPVTLMLEYDTEKNKTGTFYCGHRTRARFTARVYDKKWQMEKMKGVFISDRTRYEITVKGERGKKSPCLRDLYDPTSIFWHVASPSLLRAPIDTPEWNPVDDFSFSPEKVDSPLAYDVLQKFISDSGFISTVAKLTSRLGPYGQAYAMKMIRDSLAAEISEEGLDFPVSGLLSSIDSNALLSADVSLTESA